MLQIAQRSGRQLLSLEPGVLGIEVVDHDGEMAVSIARIVRLLAPGIGGQLEFEWGGRVAQVNQREVRKYQPIGNLEVERTGVKIERPNFIENADHRVNRLCHSVQSLARRDDGRAPSAEFVADNEICG